MYLIHTIAPWLAAAFVPAILVYLNIQSARRSPEQRAIDAKWDEDNPVGF